MKPRRLVLVVFAVTLVFALAGIAWAAAPWAIKRDDTHPSGVSGIKGTLVSSVGSKSDAGDLWFGYGLSGIILISSDGNPCSVAPKRRYFDAARTTSDGDGVREAVGKCKAPVSVPTFSGVSLPNKDWWVRGIQVCTKKTGTTAADGIAGIKIWAAKITADNAWSSVDTPEVWKTSECKTWHDKKICGDGEVALGFNAHHSGSVYRGIGLICGKVKRKKD